MQFIWQQWRYLRINWGSFICNLIINLFLQLLKAIGVVKDNKNDKDAYQDSVTAPMGREFNDDAGGDGNGSDEDMLAVGATLSKVLTVIPKVYLILEFYIGTYQFILCSSGILFMLYDQALSNVRHGLRRLTYFWKRWLQPLDLSLAVSLPCLSLMSGPGSHLPIRCCVSFIHFCMVKWESYNLLGQALDYHTMLDDFVAKNRDLHKYKLQDKNWVAIALVAKWLKLFQSAMTQMSTIKCPMLSWTHAIFQGLQNLLADSLWLLPSNSLSSSTGSSQGTLQAQ